MSRYEGTDSYTYLGSEVLINKADQRDQAALDAFDADATAIRLLEMIEHPMPGNFDLPHLQASTSICFRTCTSGLDSYVLLTSAKATAASPTAG